jgi:hypothetical protein
MSLTFKGISVIRKLLEGNEAYPPTEDLWGQIVRATKKPSPEKEMWVVQDKIRRETNTYKPALPEPTVARFFYQGEYYFLDDRNQIYKTDPGNALVGNHVGEIYQENGDFQVKINGNVIHTIKGRPVKATEIHKKSYYIDDLKQVYQGFHPKHPYLYQIGILNSNGKIELT